MLLCVVRHPLPGCGALWGGWVLENFLFSSWTLPGGRMPVQPGIYPFGWCKKVEFNHILFISCHIQPSEGGGFVFAPRADGSDGRMNVCVVSHSSRKRLIPVMLQALTGRFKKHKGARMFECREVSIHTDAPLPIHVDGEFCGTQTDLRAECISRQIRMGI